MKSKLWKKGDILEVTWTSRNFLAGTLVEFQGWWSSSEIYAVVKDNNKLDRSCIVRGDLKLVSRPGIPFKIGDKVKLIPEPEKQAIVIGFNENCHCILNQKLYPTKLIDMPAGHDFPDDAAAWGCMNLSLVHEPQTQKTNPFAKFNPLRLIRKVS